ncbi:MAG: hypothetical protein IJY27_07885 [Clostridia bacterium]|nr:hypothetical protein [Clostridia bacterium]
MNWKQKLSSRKLWAAITAFVTALATVLGADALTIEQLAALISAIGVAVTYIIGESCVDAAREKNKEEE